MYMLSFQAALSKDHDTLMFPVNRASENSSNALCACKCNFITSSSEDNVVCKMCAREIKGIAKVAEVNSKEMFSNLFLLNAYAIRIVLCQKIRNCRMKESKKDSLIEDLRVDQYRRMGASSRFTFWPPALWPLALMLRVSD